MKKIVLLISCLAIFIGNVVSQVNLSAGLVGHYKLDGNGNDASGNNNHLNNVGASSASDRNGNINSAMSFNGNDYMIGNNKSLPADSSSRTISVWVNNGTAHSNNKGQHILTYGPQKTLEGFQFFTRGTTQGPSNIIRVSAIGTSLDYNYTYQHNTWMHLVTTYENKKIKLWLDGALVDSTISIQEWNTTIDSIVIGRSDLRHWYAGFFNGVIDDIRIYDRKLSKTEIDGLFKGCFNKITTINDTIQNGDSSLIAGRYQKTSGAYSDTIAIPNGCDSTITTNLFVKNKPGNIQSSIGNNLEVTLFPNPTNGSFKIRGEINAKPLNITVINITGQIIMEKEFSTKESIDLTEFEPGIYIVHIQSAFFSSSQRIILKK